MSDDLDELMNRLKVVYGQVGGKTDGARPKGKDKFENLKYEIVKTIEQLNKYCDLRDKRRSDVRDSRTVKLKQQIRGCASALKSNVALLRALFEKEQAKAKKKKSKQTKDQLKKRHKTLKNVEQIVQDALDRADPSGAASRKREEDEADDLPHFDIESGQIVDGRGSPVSFEGAMVKTEEQLTSEDRQALALMEEEKQNQDGLLDEIGGVVDQLGVLAKGIGEELDVQNQQLNDLEVSVDEVQAHLDKVNDRLGETLKMLNSKSDKLCCYVIFLIIILGLLSIVFNMIF